MGKLELLSYCIIGENGENTACKFDCDDFNKWKKRYMGDFLVSYIGIENKPLDVRNNYFDPDGAYNNGKNHLFFEHLVKFLRKSEDCFSDELEGCFKYELEVGEGIKVSREDKKGDAIQEFYLRSDQLGFSAPFNDKSHPYDLFIAKSEDKKNAITQVCDWVSKTRTIGGSFLWPMPFYKKYNPRRGGKITSNRKYYIQDRVDLTLQEIQNWYLGVRNHDILSEVNTADSNLDIWLQHFKDFDTYVKFFCFDDFIIKEMEGKQKIKSIISETADIPSIKADGEMPPLEITDVKMDVNELGEMLNRLCNLVIKRSNKMIERINGLKKHKKKHRIIVKQ